MTIENNGPEAAYPGPAENAPDTGEGHSSGIERAASEPKGGDKGHSGDERPADWNPPPSSPGSDEDAQAGRDNSGVKTDSLIDEE